MSQLMPTAQNLPPSEKAAQLTATYQLGTLQQVYGVKMTRKTLIVGICGLVLGLLFGFLAYEMNASPRNANDISNSYFIMAIGVLGLLGALYCFCYPLLYRSWSVYVFSEGFAFTRGSKLDALRWEQINSMLISVVRRYMNGVYTGTQHKYTIRTMDGKQIVLNDRITNVGQLGDSISSMVTRVKLPEVIAAYKAGETITFGPLSVNQQGVSNGKELIGWAQVKDIRLNKGIVTVQKEGKWLNWSSAQVASIPNIFIFLALVTAIRQQSI